MKMARVILVIVLGAVIEAHAHNITTSRHVDFKDKKNETNQAYDLNDSQLHIQPLTPQVNVEKANQSSLKTSDDNNAEARVINVNAKGFETADLNQTRRTITDEDRDLLEAGILNSSEKDAKDTKTRRQDILDYLQTLLKENRENNFSKASNIRRLDIKDNGEFFPVNIDQEEAVDFRANRRTLGYGPMLDMKGRSEQGSPTNTKYYPFYLPAMIRTGPYFNPGFYPYFYPYANVPPITYTKINSGDILRLMNFPLRGYSKRLENDPRFRGNRNLNAHQADPTLDQNSNDYPFELEDSKMESYVPAFKSRPLRSQTNG